ncbi:MAG: DUF2213 domain-containing protein, partial [Oscillospiraceae bacterium]|nr:DUF2213 domain-containing protein [Oscillospiraceae bacterium]
MRLVYYGDKISPNITETPEGYLICKNVPIGRTGDMTYTRGELNLDGNPEETVTVHREESEVFNTVAIASFEGKPTTDAHPNEDVMPDNYANYAKGHGQNVRRGTEENNDKLVADLFITDPALINEVKNNIRREISCGYDCNFVPNEDGTFSQRQIRGNHIAIVRDGRAGSSVCIKDSVPASEQQPIRKERISMAKYQKSKRNPILSLFAKSVRDAKDSDEVAELIEEVAEVLDSVEKDEETEEEYYAKNPLPEIEAYFAAIHRVLKRNECIDPKLPVGTSSRFQKDMKRYGLAAMPFLMENLNDRRLLYYRSPLFIDGGGRGRGSFGEACEVAIEYIFDS